MNVNLNDIEDPQEPTPQLDDIQGVILRGYNYPYIRYLIFTIKDPAGVQDLCGKLLPGSNGLMDITTAAPWDYSIAEDGKAEVDKPPYCLNIGISYPGLNKLIGSKNCNQVWAKSFELFQLYKGGAVNDAESIGDTDESAPGNWWKNSGGWHNPTQPPAEDGSDLHIQITLYTQNSADRDTYYQRFLTMIPKVNGVAAMEEVFSKDSNPLLAGPQYIHFGYKDSFSQPRLSKVPWNKTKQRLLLGKSTVDDRPVVPPYNFAISLDKGPKGPSYNAHPLLKNGSFAAFRLLYQDVRAFNAFINDKSHEADANLVAAKMCGRWFDGTPLVVSPDKEDPSLKDFDFTNFNYHQRTANQQGDMVNDDLGQRCPYAAHIRRTNPRDDSSVKGNTDNAQSRRIMRRASAYGPEYDPAEKGEVQRGLVGLFICANLNDQFHFIMQSWITQNNFRNNDASPNLSGYDPLFGPPNAGTSAYNKFAYLPDGTPPPAKYKELAGLNRFIRTDGSMYLFLPGIDALSYISKGQIPPLPQAI